VLLADRFGGTPFDYWRIGATERERLLELLAVEAEVARAWQGLAMMRCSLAMSRR
jgi:hypothetical protein